MNKTRIAFILLCCCMIEGAFAQVIEINGGVKEARTNGTLEFANVVLQTIDSTFVMGTTTDNKGYFVLKGELKGDYLLVVSSLGYKTRYVSLNGLERDVDLGNIDLDEAVVPLDNITVDASNARSYSDRKIVYPSDRQLEASTNGINLLQQLMLPGLRVNPLFNEVRISGDGEIQYRINGVKAEVQEIVALMPTEIIRIEYHDNPGLRYGNAEVVLDYIVRRPDTGGSIGLELSNSPHVAWRKNQLSGKINHKKSEFGVNYFVSHQDYYGMWRDNEERFLFMDGSVSRRKEKGEPGRMELFWQNLQTNFSYQEPEKYLFNATFRLYTSNQPHLDYQGTLFNMEVPEDRVTVIDKTAEKLYRPALDVYYQRNLPNDQTLVFEDGVPYLRQAKQVVDIKHHQPISFGLSVRKGLAKGFSLETGLTYTLLSSDAKLAGEEQQIEQKLHYIGIPLRANWNFLDKKLVTLYVSGGGMVEKCVYGKLGSEKETVKPLQFSVSGGVGAQINATKRLGIYVEPGVAYYFNDGSDIQTIRKENPFNFNIQAGVRLTY